MNNYKIRDISINIRDLLERYPHKQSIKTPWGTIYKGKEIEMFLSKVLDEIDNQVNPESLDKSLAIGLMKPGAFHKPYMRYVEGVDGAKRVYKVLEGSLNYVRNKVEIEVNPDSDVVVVGDQDLFSFMAGVNGCVFMIIDYPAFNPFIDANT